jgi:hypothetical protein
MPRADLLHTLSYSWSWHASFLLLLNCYAHAHQEGIYRPSMVYMDYVYFNITMSRSLRVGQEFVDCNRWVQYVRTRSYSESSGIFRWISRYYVARDSNDFNAQPLFWQVAGHLLFLHVRIYLLQIQHLTTSIQRKYSDTCSGATGYMSSGNVFYFFLGNL